MKTIQSANLNRQVATRNVPRNISHSNISQVVSMYFYSNAKLAYQKRSIDATEWVTFSNEFH